MPMGRRMQGMMIWLFQDLYFAVKIMSSSDWTSVWNRNSDESTAAADIFDDVMERNSDDGEGHHHYVS